METPNAAVVVETGEEVEIVALETSEAVETVEVVTIEVETGEALETVEMDCYSETQCIPFAIEW